jgi:hypothetical protein
MANKDINIKIKVDGKEIPITGKQVDVFKKNIVDLKKQLEELGDRTEENGEIFDKLKGDLQSLEKVFGDVKNETSQATEGMEEFGDETEEAASKTKTLRSQLSEARNSLAALGTRTSENAQEYDRLTNRVLELSEAYEDVQFGTKKLDDALVALPGPIGKAAQGFKFLDDGLKNARSAMANLTRTFPILKNAIAATGIGALVIILGLLVAAVMKAFNSFKPLQDAVGKLGIVFDLLGKMVQPLIDLIGKGLTFALEGLAKAIAFVTGNMDEFNEAVADKKATEDLEKNVKKQEELLDANGYKYDEFTKRKIQANIDYNKKKLELDADETRSEAEKLALLKQYRDKANNEILEADKDRNKKSEDLKKSASDKAADLEKSFQDKLKSIRNENILLEIQDEADKNRTKLKMDLDTQMKDINQLIVSEKKKEELRKETLRNYELLLKEFNENILKEQKKADDDLARQIRDIRTSMIEDEKERLKSESDNRREDTLKAIDETIASEEAKTAAKLAINEKYKQDIAKIEEGITKKSGEEIFRQIEFERQSRELGLQNRLKQIDFSVQSEVDKIKARSLVFRQQAELDNAAEIDNLKKLLESKQITQKEFDEREKIINEAIRLSNLENTIISENQIRQTKFDIRNNALNDLISIAGAETNVGKALLVAKQLLMAKELVMEVQRTITFSTQAAARSTVAVAEGTAQTAKIGFPQNIPMLIAYAAQAVGIIAAIRSAVKSAKSAGSGSTGEATPNLGRNYEKGGMIGGRRHAQGGTLIEAEAGEAVMTRGAVTMFAPMLSMMNQMGGGTSFGNQLFSRPDAPNVEKPQQEQAPIIMKTYVVSNELTSESEKLARLKDLSTL